MCSSDLDFSLGLDPGYRRLFTDYLREFAKAEEKTVFMTSHIIQDLERLIDDCIILDYGKILTQMPVDELLRDFCRYTLQTDMSVEKFLADSLFVNPGKIKDELEFYTFKPIDEVRAALGSLGVDSGSLVRQDMSLEDAFIGLTGKY